MPKLKKTDIYGYEVSGEYYCADCAESRGKDDVPHDKLLTSETMSRDDVYYCADCGKRIGSGGSGGGGGRLF